MVALINVVLTYAGFLLVNLWFEYRDFSHSYEQSARSSIEQEARAIDAAYFRACLSRDHAQIFYPDLLEQEKYEALARSSGFLPLGPAPKTDIAYCNEGYGFVRYRSDRYGFRNADEQWDRPVDALLVGDSYVQGACVPNDSHLSRILTDRHGLNAVNVGTGSNGPNHYRALIEAFVPLARPRHAVLFFYPNDLTPVEPDDPYLIGSGGSLAPGYTGGGISDAGAAFFARASQMILDDQQVEEDKSICKRTNLGHPVVRSRIEAQYRRSKNPFDAERIVAFAEKIGSESPLSELFGLKFSRRTLGQLLDRADALTLELLSPASVAAIDELFTRCVADCSPVVVLLPNSNYWRIDTRAAAYFSAIADYLARNHLPSSYALLDLRGLIDQDGLDHFGPVGPHYSKEGYEVVARALAPYLLGPVRDVAR